MWQSQNEEQFASRRNSMFSVGMEAASVQTIRYNQGLLAPLPNLFRATFESAHQQSPGETWLKQRMMVFDAGSKQRRKHVLEEFLEYMQHSTATSMQELFSHQAHLFFIRLTSWFAVTLPMFYELPLQVKVFLSFLEFHEQSFVRAFFESGAVATLMHTLSVNFDGTDEIRCLVIMAFKKLAAHGRYHKELLCAEGLISKVMDCMSGGMQWETLKCAGRLLCELFCANPKYQHEVLETLQSLLSHKLPLTQRVGAQAVISLLHGDREEISLLLRNTPRHIQLIQLSLPLLDSADLRVGADAYCLVCRLVVSFDCDELLYKFCESQILDGDNLDEWLRLELDSQNSQIRRTADDPGIHATGNQQTPFGGWWNMSTERLYNNIQRGLAENEAAEGGLCGTEDVVKLVKKSNADFCEAFRKESSQVLKWSLMLFILKRCPRLCHQLVDEGLTETLLMCLLDVAHPVRQGAALSELHRLQLVSTLATKIVADVIVKPNLIHATSLVEFMQLAKPVDLDRARYRLRNIWNSLHCIKSCHEPRFSADELNLRQKLLEKEMMDEVGVEPNAKGFFLTDVITTDKDARAAEKEKEDMLTNSKGFDNSDTLSIDDIVHRSGKDKFDVRRAPTQKSSGGGGFGDEHSRIEMGPMEEIPFSGSLSSLMFDPLDVSADEESPLIQEMRTIQGLGEIRSLNKKKGKSVIRSNALGLAPKHPALACKSRALASYSPCAQEK